MMKKTLLNGILSLSLIAVLTGCSDEGTFEGGATGKGRIAPTVGLDTQTISSRASRGLLDNYSASDLQLKVIPADGSSPYSWDSVDDFDSNTQFKVGDYTIEVSRGAVEVEGFDQPAFFGSASLKVKENQVSEVSVNAKLVNAMVTVEFSEAFQKYMTDYSAELHADEGQYLYYGKDETRPVFVRPGNTLLNVTMTKPNGTTATVQAAHFTTQPCYHYVVKVDVNEGNVGQAESLVINFDENLAQEDVTIDISDEVVNASAPVITAEGFTSGESIDFVPGMLPDGNFKVNIVARGGLGSVKLNTLSASLQAQGWPAEVDLIGASAATQATLKGLGLSCLGLFKNPDKMAVIDLTDVLPHITTVDGDNANVFTITVTDKYNKTGDVTLALNAENLAVELLNPSQINEGDTEMTVDVLYNGKNPAENVKIQTPNDRGTWSNVVVNSVDELPDTRYMKAYRFHITVPSGTGTFKLRASVGEAYYSEEVSVTYFVLTFGLQLTSENDIFATHAKVRVTSTEGQASEIAALGKVLVAEGKGDFAAGTCTADGDVLTLTGLKPSTTYRVRVCDAEDHASGIVTLTTEAAPQLPNPGMDEWFTVPGQTEYWWTEYPGTDTNAAWGTMNQLTVSEGGTNTSWLSTNRNAFSYCAFSGTRKTDDKYSGASAAIIETIGWGKGNSAVAAGAISNAACKNATPGQLYLGYYNASTKQPVYGYAFNGRPSALTFWYKYTPKNSADYGYAEITILDAAGNELATNSKQITAAAEYTQETFNLTYGANAAKAASIRVVFRSSDNADCLKRESGNFNSPGTGNSSGRWSGSSLYIDELELVY